MNPTSYNYETLTTVTVSYVREVLPTDCDGAASVQSPAGATSFRRMFVHYREHRIVVSRFYGNVVPGKIYRPLPTAAWISYHRIEAVARPHDYSNIDPGI
jgi:hypothetical protein